MLQDKTKSEGAPDARESEAAKQRAGYPTFNLGCYLERSWTIGLDAMDPYVTNTLGALVPTNVLGSI